MGTWTYLVVFTESTTGIGNAVVLLRYPVDSQTAVTNLREFLRAIGIHQPIIMNVVPLKRSRFARFKHTTPHVHRLQATPFATAPAPIPHHHDI